MNLKTSMQKFVSRLITPKKVIEARNTKIDTTIFNAQKSSEQISQNLDTLHIYEELKLLGLFNLNKDNNSNNYRNGLMSYFDNDHNAKDFKEIVETSTNYKVEIIQ